MGMDARPPSTGFAALNGLLKRAREQKKANPAPSKRVAIANISETSEENDGNTHRPNVVALSQAQADKDIGSLDDGDAFLDYVPDDIDDLLNGLPLEDEAAGLQHQRMAQTGSPQRRSVNAADTAGVRTTRPQVSQQVSFNSRLTQFEYRTPAGPPAEKTKQVDAARSAQILQQHSAKKSAASSVGRSASSSVFKTIERTIINSKRQKTATSASGRQELPGPAGLINATTEDVGETIAPTQRPASVFRTPFARQPGAESASEADFEGGTWSAMLEFLQLPAYTSRTAKRIMRDYKETVGVSIHWVSKNVKQTQKVCRMLVQIQDIVGGEHDVNAVVVDPTGEMSASIHRQVVVDLARECTAGTSVILENVVVLVLAGAKPSLVVTSASIVRVFAVEASGSRYNPIVLTQTQTQAQRQAQMDDQGGNPSQETPTRRPHSKRLQRAGSNDQDGGEYEGMESSVVSSSSQVHPATALSGSPRVASEANENDESDEHDALDDLGDVFMEGPDDVDNLLDMLDPSL